MSTRTVPIKIIERIRREFRLPAEGMTKIIKAFHREMDLGLAGKKSSLKMLPTYVDKPTGKEKGEYLALDLGGTNFRVLSVSLKGSGAAPEIKTEKFQLKTEHITGDAETLFDALVGYIKLFLDKHGLKRDYKLGFTFSFPIDQMAIDKGKLIVWTKDFSADGVVGEDVVRLLNKALRKKGIANVRVVSIDNDTTGTMVARAYLDPACDIGVILGTGTNICVRMPASSIKKKIGPYSGEYMIINMESGNFNKALPVTRYDKMLDERSDNRGEQIEEKMVSGKYLGEVARLVLLDLAKRKILFKGKAPSVIRNIAGFESRHVSAVEESSPEDIREMEWLKEGVFISIEEAEMIKEICAIVSTRAARVAASLLAAAVLKIDPELTGPHTIAVEGSVFEKHPRFEERMKETFRDLFGPEKASLVKMSLTHDGSGLGAAIIAAVSTAE